MRSRLSLVLGALALIAAGGCGEGRPDTATATAAAQTTTAPKATAAARNPHPPVVVLMFDEFETAALFDSDLRIDPVRYPHLADLAKTATVYRRFTAEGDITGPATGSLLASRPYRLGHRGIYKNFPDNIFTRFHRGGYRMVVRETATALCPRCSGDHAPQDARDVVNYLASNRIARFDEWLRQINRPQHPTLFFDHTLLPHNPLVYTPSGKRYRVGGHEPIPGFPHKPSFADPWFVRQGQQRYLMQVELADALVGRMEARLKAQGLWDRATVVVTADNGEGWGHLDSDPHRIDKRTLAQIVQTPLIFKAPGQRRGGYSDKRVRVVDLLPTLARLAHLPTGGMAGRSFLGPGASRIPAEPIRAFNDDGRVYRFTGRSLERQIRANVASRIAIFGQHTRNLFRIGPEPALLGQPVSGQKVGVARNLRGTLGPQPQLAHVERSGYIVPTHLVGSVRGKAARRGLPIAVAVNGTIAATGRTARLRGSSRNRVSLMIPESALQDGRNQVRLFLIRRGGLARVRLG